jgi:hypothetical protein
MKAHGVMEAFLMSVLDGVSGQLHTPIAEPSTKESNDRIGGWVGPTANLISHGHNFMAKDGGVNLAQRY